MNTKNEAVNNFFSYLSLRGKENYLSDIIATYCNVSFTFKKVFLEFMFPNDEIMSRCPSAIEREVSANKGKYRFDLYFSTVDGAEYVIENKIYDRNDHFNEYSKIIPNNLGLITNYETTGSIKYKNKHTWLEFFNHIVKIKTIFPANEILLIEGLINYIKGTCNIMDERNFNLSKLNDLGYIIKLFKQIMDNAGYTINYRAKGSAENRIGFWGYKEPRSYWFGVYLDEEQGFSIWGGIYNYELKGKQFKNLKYSNFHSITKEDNCWWFELKQNYLNKLCNDSLDYDKKHKLIKDFINEIEAIY